jgi:hypothetical protein
VATGARLVRAQLDTMGEMVRVAPTLATRMKHLEELLVTKASHEDFSRRTEELAHQLARKVSDCREMLQAHRGEVQVRGARSPRWARAGADRLPNCRFSREVRLYHWHMLTLSVH